MELRKKQSTYLKRLRLQKEVCNDALYISYVQDFTICNTELLSSFWICYAAVL